MAAVQRPPSLNPDNHGRSVDIIDVDLLDDEIIDSRPSRRRRLSGTTQLQPDIITVLDSDDEIELQTGPSQPRSGQSSNRRMVSPPPPLQDYAIPPVPEFPPHLYEHQSFPVNRNARPLVSGIADNMQRPPLAAAPPSHHVPSMGFGGALLAVNRPNITHGNNIPGNGHGARLPRPLRSRSAWALPSIGDILSGDYFRREQQHFQGPEADLEEDALYALLTAHDDNHTLQRPLFISEQARRLRHFEPDYRPAYTHPGKPLPGFTFDFASPVAESSSSSKSVIVVDDFPGSSTSASSSSHGGDPNTILVCARCMEGLVTGDANTGVEQTRRRIWALRCGHLIDGKCVEEIMKPALPLPIVPVDVEEKGKEFEMFETSRLDKGKGKAFGLAPSETPSSLDSPTSPREHSSIRSRLRPRPNSSTASDITLPSDHIPSARPVRPLPFRRQPGRGRGRGKGKGKAKAPVVDAEHHWNCPVAGCGKVHTSLLIGEKWIMDEKSGAIPVYV